VGGGGAANARRGAARAPLPTLILTRRGLAVEEAE
jgi:hypothetical protein